MLKDFQVDLELSPRDNRVIQTGATYWSHDVNTAKINIKLLRYSEPVILNKDVTVRVMMLFDDENKSEHIYTAKIEDEKAGIVSVILDKNVRSYVGQVICGVYADYGAEQKTDNGYFTFAMKRSLIDKRMPEMKQYYVSDFEDTLAKMKLTNAEFATVETKLNGRIDVIENKIKANDIVTKPDFNALEHDFKTFNIGATNRFAYKHINKNIKVIGRQIQLDGGWPATIMDNQNIRLLRLSPGFTYKMRYAFRLDEDPSSYVPYEQLNHGTLALVSSDSSKYPTINLGSKSDNVEEAKKMKKGSVVSRSFEFTMPADISSQTDYKLVAYTYRAMTPQGEYVKNLAGTFLEIQIEYGSKFTDNQPAFEDLATYQEANALQKQIDDIKKAITTLGGTL